MAKAIGPMSCAIPGGAPGLTQAIRPQQKRARAALFAAALILLAAPALAQIGAVEGTLQVLTADDFAAAGPGRYTRCEPNGNGLIELRLPAPRADLRQGMHIRATGRRNDGQMTVERLEILATPPSKAAVQAPAVTGTSSVIVILFRWLDSPPRGSRRRRRRPPTAWSSPPRTASSATTRRTPTTRTRFRASRRRGLTARINKPTTCDYISAANEAEFAANQAGYVVNNYQKRVYVYPQLPGCGWAGLGGGSQAWCPVFNHLVVGHELGHCFGWGHSSSLDCGAAVIGGPCTRSEYGNPFAIMGNNRSGHVGAEMKQQAGYFPAGTTRRRTRRGRRRTISIRRSRRAAVLRREGPDGRAQLLARAPRRDRLRRLPGREHQPDQRRGHDSHLPRGIRLRLVHPRSDAARRRASSTARSGREQLRRIRWPA